MIDTIFTRCFVNAPVSSNVDYVELGDHVFSLHPRGRTRIYDPAEWTEYGSFGGKLYFADVEVFSSREVVR